MQAEQLRKTLGGRISIPEIAGRLSVGRMAVYQLLESRTIPAIRLGRRWIVTRHAYEQWEKTCGMSGAEHIPLPERVAQMGN
jgi:excisionase family DNA binding protein